jgi:hypothetical protein
VVKITLQFKSLFELLEFKTVAKAYGADFDYRQVTVTGYFKEIDIELATAAFNATIRDTGSEE